jgi:hypothetical protein
MNTPAAEERAEAMIGATRNKIFIVLFLIALIAAIGGIGFFYFFDGGGTVESFDGQRALQDVAFQTELGPRVPGSEAHRRVVDWIQTETEKHGWQTQVQDAVMLGHPIVNVVAKRLPDQDADTPWIIIGAHFDSRLIADKDPDPQKRSQPVPGANDGASGVAVLMELARTLSPDLQKEVWLVFFDAEDNGNIPGWDWILGSRAFVDNLESQPDAVVIVDMIGDANLNIHIERNSNAELTAQIWATAAKLGYSEAFIPLPKYSILDDHTPFLNAGIPAVDIIDFDYPYWHTSEDTVDKVSDQSLQIVGEVLTAWLTQNW